MGIEKIDGSHGTLVGSRDVRTVTYKLVAPGVMPSQNRHKYQPTVVNCIEHCVVHRTVSNVIKLNRISDMMTYSGCGNVDWVQPLWVCLAQSVRC